MPMQDASLHYRLIKLTQQTTSTSHPLQPIDCNNEHVHMYAHTCPPPLLSQAWQAYIDSMVPASGCAGGLYDLQGNPWACSEGFMLQVDEVAAVSGWLHSSGRGVAGMTATGAVIAGVKNMFVRGDDDEKWCYLKKGKLGITFVACTQCIVVLQHDENTQQGASTMAAQNIGDTLKGAGY